MICPPAAPWVKIFLEGIIPGTGEEAVMAEKDDKKKQHEKEHRIYKAGDKYHCIECGSEVKEYGDCPKCHAKFNWLDILGNARPF
jgi:hypothetical protein